MMPASVVFLTLLLQAQPLTLRQAVQEALQHGQTVAVADDRVELAEGQVRIAESRFGLQIAPSLGAGAEPTGLWQQSAAVTVTRKLATGAQLMGRADSIKYQTGTTQARDAGYTFAISQPLLRGAGRAARAELDDARWAAASSHRGRDEARQDTILQVVHAYFGVVRQQRLLAVSEKGLDRARALLAASEARARVGLVTQLDVLRAELGVSQAESALAQQRQAIQDAADALKLVMGRPVAGDVTVSGEELDRLSAMPLLPDGSRDPQELVRLALSSRPMMTDAQAQVARAEHAERIASWNLLPQLDVTASYTKRGLGHADSDALHRLWGGWRVGLTSSYSLDRTVAETTAAAATLSTRAAARTSADTERRVEAEVMQAHRALQRAEADVRIQEKAAALADKQRQLAQLRYDRGLAGNFDVVDAEASLMQAQSAMIAAYIDRALATVGVRRATGTLSLEDLPR